jgi:cation diffusion facilitator family transporter
MTSNGVKEKIAVISVLANVILAVTKIFAGILSKSTAVLAEGFHSLADIFSSLISFFGIKIAKKPADKEHPYGHFKFEVLAGFLITLILFGTGLTIIYEAYQKFLNPSFIKIPILALSVMIFSALVNETMSRLKIHFGKKENSVALISDGVHSRIDVFTSLAVFVGLVLNKYWIYTDSILAFLIGLYIVKESFSIGKEAIDSLLDVSAPPEVEEKIKEIAKSQGIEISDLKTQKKGSVFTANLDINLSKNLKVDEATKISEGLRERLMKEIKNLVYVAIQIKSHEVETGFYRPAFRGFGFGQGFGWRRRGRFTPLESKPLTGFRGKIEEAQGRGPGGYCVCKRCGYKVEHQPGVPCSSLICPNCKINLTRE